MATSHWHELAERLKRTLGLHYPPIAITFRQDLPEGTPLYDAAMPSPSTDDEPARSPQVVSFGSRLKIERLRRSREITSTAASAA